MDLLSNGSYRSLGDSRDRRANVRIIATNSTDLKEAVLIGRFRPDLHFKLTLMTVRVPALRDRREDTMPLLDHFLTKLEGSTLTARSLFDFRALEALAIHHWPGNIAELESVAQRAWLNRDLGQSVHLRRVEGKSGPNLEFIFPENPRPDSGAGASAVIDRHIGGGMTWSSLNALIDRAGGNKSHVARNLNISRVTLYRWLDRLDPKS
jgi:DNA-binding NtrC family response regulator